MGAAKSFYEDVMCPRGFLDEGPFLNDFFLFVYSLRIRFGFTLLLESSFLSHRPWLVFLEIEEVGCNVF